MLLVIGGFISITILGVFALGRFIIFGMRNRPLTDGDLIGIAFFSVALFVGLCFGLLAIIEGGWRAATGRSSRVIGPGMVTLAVLLIVLGFCSALFR